MKRILFVTHENLEKTAVSRAMFRDVAFHLQSNNGIETSILSASEKAVSNAENEYVFLRTSYGKADFKALLQAITSIKMFIKLCKKHDIVYFRSYPSILLFGFIAKIMGKKIIFDTRGLFFEELTDSGKIKGDWSLLFSFLEKFLIRISNSVICVTDSQKVHFLTKYNGAEKKLTVIPNGSPVVPVSSIKANFTESGPIQFCYLGSLVKWHAPDLVVRFLKELSSRGVQYSLDVLTTDIENAERIFSELNCVKIRTHNFRQEPICYDYGFCFIEGGVSKDICFPVKFCEYLNSGTKVLSLSNVAVVKGVIEKYKGGIIFHDKTPSIMVDEFLAGHKQSFNLKTTLPNEYSFQHQLSLISLMLDAVEL